MREHPPTTYNAWFAALEQLQYAADGFNEHKCYTGPQTHRKTTHHSG